MISKTHEHNINPINICLYNKEVDENINFIHNFHIRLK